MTTPGYLGAALACAHHTHTDRQLMICLAAAWGLPTVAHLEATFLALLLSNKEHALTTPPTAPAPVVVAAPTPGPEPAPVPPTRKRRTTSKRRQRLAVVRALLEKKPDAVGPEVHAALKEAGYDVSERCAHYDLAAVRGKPR